jgi:hypothetical protein
MELFETRFAHFKKKFLLRNMGLSEKHQNQLLQKHASAVTRFETLFEHFERQQSAKGVYKVDDGITSDAVFCMRDLLRELPKLFLADDTTIKDSTFIEIARSSYAEDKDLSLTPSRSRHIQNFQKQYRRLLHLAGENDRRSFHRILLEITMRSSLINRHDRITGNGIIRVADHLVKKKIANRGSELLSLLPEFIRYQVQGLEISPRNHGTSTAPVLRRLIQIVQDSREEI